MKKHKLTTRQKESKKINRKRAVRQWWKVMSRRAFIIIVLITLVAIIPGLFWLGRSGKIDSFVENTSTLFWQKTVAAGFKVDNVYLEGRKFTSVYEISKALQVKTGDPILKLSLEQIRKNLQSIPRVKFAAVERILPNQLRINIMEREPIAIWQNEGKFYLIDSDGVVMDSVESKDYKNMLLVVGENAPIHTGELLSLLSSEQDLYKNILSVIRVGERRWNVRFKTGIELKLPEDKSDEAWHNFAKIEHENHILERAIKSVDMRVSDRVFIKTIPVEKEQDKTIGSDI